MDDSAELSVSIHWKNFLIIASLFLCWSMLSKGINTPVYDFRCPIRGTGSIPNFYTGVSSKWLLKISVLVSHKNQRSYHSALHSYFSYQLNIKRNHKTAPLKIAQIYVFEDYSRAYNLKRCVSYTYAALYWNIPLFLVPYSHKFSRVLNFVKSTDSYFARLYFRDFRVKRALYFRVFCYIAKINTRENKWE